MIKLIPILLFLPMFMSIVHGEDLDLLSTLSELKPVMPSGNDTFINNSDGYSEMLLMLLRTHVNDFERSKNDCRMPMEGPMISLDSEISCLFSKSNGETVSVDWFRFSKDYCVLQIEIHSEEAVYYRWNIWNVCERRGPSN